MKDIKYPKIGFEHALGGAGNSVWGLEFRCGVCDYFMLQHSNALSHNGLNEKCLQYKTVFEPVFTEEGVFKINIRLGD